MSGYHTFGLVKEFVYLSSAVSSNNRPGNQSQKKSWQQMLLWPQQATEWQRLLLCNITGALQVAHTSCYLPPKNIWALLRIDAAALGVIERKILLKIFSRECQHKVAMIRTSRELYDIFNDVNRVQCINFQQLRWLTK